MSKVRKNSSGAAHRDTSIIKINVTVQCFETDLPWVHSSTRLFTQEMSNGLTVLKNNGKDTKGTSIKFEYRFPFSASACNFHIRISSFFLYPHSCRLQPSHSRCKQCCISRGRVAGETHDSGEFQLIKVTFDGETNFKCIAVACCPLHRWSSQKSRDQYWEDPQNLSLKVSGWLHDPVLYCRTALSRYACSY